MTNGTKALQVFEEPLELLSDGLVVSVREVVSVPVFVDILEVPEFEFVIWLEAELDMGTLPVPEEFEDVEEILLSELDASVVEDTVEDELVGVNVDVLKLV
jgi:hypothetical protein